MQYQYSIIFWTVIGIGYSIIFWVVIGIGYSILWSVIKYWKYLVILSSFWCTFYHFREAKIPLDPYFGAVLLATIRAIMAIFGSSMANKFKKRTTFIICDIIMCNGTIMLATYYYMNQNGKLTEAFPYARWIPIIAILVMYLAFACGIGSIPYSYQVSRNFVPNFLKRFRISIEN